MRHRRAGVHLSRTSAHRKALFSNLVAALFTHDRIRTTEAKAKETRRLAERTITWARRVGDIFAKKADRRTPEEAARVVHAVRMARRLVRDRSAVLRLFGEIGPRYAARRGGYTRIVKLGWRPGDAAPMSLLELIPEEGAPPPAGGKPGEKKGGEKQAAEAGKKAEARGQTAKPAKGGKPAKEKPVEGKGRKPVKAEGKAATKGEKAKESSKAKKK